MSLVDDAFQAYEKSILADKESEEKEKKKLIEDGLQNIKDRFGDNLKIDVTSDKDRDVVFLVDGLKMKVRKSQGYYNIYLLQTCPKCKEDYADTVISLKDIGKLLREGHNTFDCDKILKSKEPVKELNTDERLIQALKVFIYENSPEM